MSKPSAEVLDVGDVVRLTSSITRMTVKSVGEKIVCRWFDASDDLLSDEFDRDELILVKRAGVIDAR